MACGRLAGRRFVCASLLCLVLSDAVLLELPARGSRCVGEDMADDAMGKFTFEVIHPKEAAGEEISEEKSKQTSGITVVVTSPKTQLLSKVLTYLVEPFPFTAVDPGMHQICFHNNRKEPRRVNLEVETDLAVKDYSELVRKEHLKPLELQFRKAEDKLKSISKEMGKSREREAQLRVTSDAMSNRIQWMSFLSITVLLTVSAWQIFYLKSFFRSKKLL